MMIEFYKFTNFNKPDPSPFCAKIELYLKIHAIPFEIKSGDVTKAPKQKYPIIKDEGKIVCDSEHIVAYLNRKHNLDMDSHLSLSDKAVAHAFKKMLEEYMYFILMYSRWVDNRIWPSIRPLFFSNLPMPLKLFVPELVRKSVRKCLHLQGLGRHTQKEVYDFGIESIRHLSNFLGDKPYMMSDKISSVDLSAFAFVYNAIEFFPFAEINEAAKGHDNLKAYAQRILSQYWA